MICHQTILQIKLLLTFLLVYLKYLRLAEVYILKHFVSFLYIWNIDQCADSDGCGGCWTYALFQDTCYSLKDCSKTTFQERTFSGDVNCPPHSGYKSPSLMTLMSNFYFLFSQIVFRLTTIVSGIVPQNNNVI